MKTSRETSQVISTGYVLLQLRRGSSAPQSPVCGYRVIFCFLCLTKCFYLLNMVTLSLLMLEKHPGFVEGFFKADHGERSVE